jgi:hypothetical protein
LLCGVARAGIRGVDNATKPLTAPIKSLKDLQSVASKLGPIVAATAGALGTAFVGLTRHAINLQDETGKLAQKAGTTAEAFSTLAYAGKLNDVTSEQLSAGFRKLNQEIVAVPSGSAGAASGLSRLGISVKDAEGKLRPAEQIMLDVAERLKGMADGSVKSALALDIFGKSGTELIPMLNQGRDGIEQLQAEARRLGIEVSGGTSVAADEFNNDLARLTSIAQGVADASCGGALRQGCLEGDKP